MLPRQVTERRHWFDAYVAEGLGPRLISELSDEFFFGLSSEAQQGVAGLDLAGVKLLTGQKEVEHPYGHRRVARSHRRASVPSTMEIGEG